MPSPLFITVAIAVAVLLGWWVALALARMAALSAPEMTDAERRAEVQAAREVSR